MQPYVVIPSNGSDPADEWVRLGLEAQMAGKHADADRCYRQALRLDPRHAVATQNLAVLFAQQGNLNEGLLAIERAALFDGRTPVIHVNRAFMNLEADRIEEALAAARHAVDVAFAPPATVDAVAEHGFIASRLALAIVSATAGAPSEAVPLYNEVLDRQPNHPVAAPNACFVQTLTPASPAELLAQRRRWWEANHHQAGPRTSWANDKHPHRPLRVGYVGGDFKRHSAAMIFGSVVLNHDPGQVETFLYSTLPGMDPVADDMTRRFQQAAGPRWRDVSAKTDDEAEALILKDKIDILVDLAGHTNGGRLALFTRKPAPIQATGWGFAHGSGLPEMDAFFADPVAVPPEERGYYAERIVDLPCIVSYLPPTEYGLKGKSALPFHANDCITFGSYARYEKLSDECLRTFAAILQRVPGSRLEFKDHAFRRPYSIKRVMELMRHRCPKCNGVNSEATFDRGGCDECDGEGTIPIAPERLLFSISTTHPDHLLAYQQADLALDPFPHSGGVVCLEQLWMGVPLVTLRGNKPSGRTAASVLSLLGMASFVAETPEHYVEIAVAAANNTPVLQQARRELRDKLLASPVVSGYREAVERAYRQLWKEWCSK